jgi:hypothetical protein
MFFSAFYFQTVDIDNIHFSLYPCSLLVMTSVECQWLVYKHRIVRGHAEENLCGHQAIDIRLPDVESNPQLGEEPQRPHPNVLAKQMFISIRQGQTQTLAQRYRSYQTECRNVWRSRKGRNSDKIEHGKPEDRDSGFSWAEPGVLWSAR